MVLFPQNKLNSVRKTNQHLRNDLARDQNLFVYLFFFCVSSPDQTKNDRDLKFGTYTTLEHISKKSTQIWRYIIPIF